MNTLPPLRRALACLWAAFAAPGCGGASDVPAPGAPERVVSLARLARDVPGARREVWSLDRDRRALVAHDLPGRLVLGPLAGGSDCVLRFGIALGETPAHAAATFRVRASQRIVFEETLPAPARWQDREVPLPPSETPYRLALEAERSSAGASGARAQRAEGERSSAGWSQPRVVCGAAAPRPSSRPLVLLISLDTLRADHLGVYGYPEPTSPRLDAFAEEALVFANAFATAPWTLPSHASMLTGLYPDEHGAGHEGPIDALGPDVPTLAERMADAGYRSVAFTAGAVMSRASGLDRGFAEWTEYAHANLRSVLPEVLDVLSAPSERPLFLFLHTYDIHGPYDQPASFRGAARPQAMTSGDLDRAAFERRVAARLVWPREAQLRPHGYLELDRYRGRDELVAAYDDGIRFVDAQLGRLFDHLRRNGLLDGALVVVTSDHGESLLERGVYVGHSYLLTDDEVRIPLLARLPGGRPRGRVEQLVDLADVAPLVLDVVGVPAAGLSGASPLARLEGRAPERRLVRGEAAHTGARFARTRAWKVILPAFPWGDPALRVAPDLRGRFDGGEQVFQLEDDPGERRNLAGAPLPPEVAELRALAAARDRPGGGATPDPETLPPALREQLRILGYLE